MHSSSEENNTSPFDEALQVAGGFGRFQVFLVTVLLSTATLHYSSNHLSQIFILLPPDQYGCRLNGSELLYRCGLKNGEKFAPSDLFAEETVNSCEQGWEFIMGELFPTLATQNNWVCGDSWKQYATHTLFSVGSMTGYLVAGFLSDRYGRKPTIMALAFLAAAANLLPLAVHNDLAIVLARFLAGVGADTTCSIVFLLVMEYTIPSHRTLIGTAWATGWTILGGLYPWYAKYVFGYKYLLVTTSVISGALIIMCLLVPESASWLVSTDRVEEAKENLVKIARINGKKNVSEIDFKTLLLAIDSNGTSDVGSMDTTTSEDSNTSTNSFWAETVALITTPNLRRTTLLLFCSWFLICLCYHADTLGLGHLGLSIYPAYSMTAAFELPINVFTIFCLDSVGRRWPNVIFMASAGILAFTFAWIGDTGGPNVTMLLAVLLIVSLAGSYNVTYQLAAELFPTVVRGRGVLLSKVCGDFGNVVATLVAYLVEINKNALFVVVGVLALIGAIFLFFIPETTHEPLPQTFEDGENFGKDQALCYCPIFARDLPEKQKRSPSLTNVSYTIGRPATSVQPTSTPKTNSKFTHGKRSQLRERKTIVTQEPIITVEPGITAEVASANSKHLIISAPE